MPDQDGDSDRAPSFFIDYLRVEIVYLGSNAEAKKMKILKFLWKSDFHQFFIKFTANLRKSNQNQIKISEQWLVEQDSIPRLEE